MDKKETESERTTVYVPDRDRLRSRIYTLRSNYEVAADSEMKEIYPAMFHAALQNPRDVIEYLENKGDSQ